MISSASFLTAAAAFAFISFVDATSFTFKAHTPTAFAPASPDVVTDKVLSLNRKKSSSRKAGYLSGIAQGRGPNSNYEYGSTGLISLFIGEEFDTVIKVGGKNFTVIVDTGSSDTWLAETGFSCVDQVTYASEPEATCDFGPLYTLDKSFKEISNENFNITYGDGEFLNGFMGYDQVEVAGITVPKQEIGVANYAAWDGDGTSSGLMGLAYPALTSAFYGTTPKADSGANQAVYNPIFTTMYKSGLVAPVFSLAIERANSGAAGYLAIGGLPPVKFIPIFASAPIQLITTSFFNGSAIAPQYQFYTIIPEAFVYEDCNKTSYTAANWATAKPPTSNTKFPVIVDSGTTLNYLPTNIANAVNALFDPPAVYSDDEGAYVVDCNAKAPSFGVTIGGKTFYTNPLDMILNTGDNVCITGIDDGGALGTGELYILGDVFLKNVVAVYDVGAAEMRFAAREFYTIS